MNDEQEMKRQREREIREIIREEMELQEWKKRERERELARKIGNDIADILTLDFF